MSTDESRKLIEQINKEFRRRALKDEQLSDKSVPGKPPIRSREYSFFRMIFSRKPSSREAAGWLFVWAFHANGMEEQAKLLQENFRHTDYATLYWEYVYLRMFIADWVIQGAEHQDERMHAVRVDFNQLVVLMTKQQPQPNEMMKEFETHLGAYAAAVNKDHHFGAPWAIATTFCELCGDRSQAKDISEVTAVSIEIGVLVKCVDEILRGKRKR